MKSNDLFKRFDRLSFIFITVFCVLSLCACGGPTSENKLVRKAKSQYGKASVISSSYSDRESSVTLKDDAQGFVYTIYDNYYAATLDGEEFGFRSSHISDDFDERLAEYVFTQAAGDIDAACIRYNAHWMPQKDGIWYAGITLIVYINDPNTAENLALECAEALEKQNVKNRLNGASVKLIDANDDTLIGKVNLNENKYISYK